MKTICKQCPLDSESTNLEVDELEDHCVCLPCELRQCGANETVSITAQLKIEILLLTLDADYEL